MANILYRASTSPTVPGSTTAKTTPLTNLEIDGNFKSLNDDLLLRATLASPTFTGTVVLPSTTSIGNVTNIELNYLDGVTSAIQTQFSNKAPLTGEGTSGTWSISVSGNSASVTNGVYTSGSYANPSWITSLSETKVLPSQTTHGAKYLTTNGTVTSWTTFGNGVILPVASGGSGVGTLTGVLKGNGTSAFTAATANTDFLPVSGGIASGFTLNDGYTEEVFAVTGTTPALSPTNGSIQTWTLTAASTPTAGTWAAGQSITLMVDDGTAYAITWTSVAITWKTDGGVAPTLNTTGLTAIQLWKVGTTIYGARVGDA